MIMIDGHLLVLAAGLVVAAAAEKDGHFWSFHDEK